MTENSQNLLLTPKKEGFILFNRHGNSSSASRIRLPVSDKKIQSVQPKSPFCFNSPAKQYFPAIILFPEEGATNIPSPFHRSMPQSNENGMVAQQNILSTHSSFARKGDCSFLNDGQKKGDLSQIKLQEETQGFAPHTILTKLACEAIFQNLKQKDPQCSGNLILKHPQFKYEIVSEDEKDTTQMSDFDALMRKSKISTRDFLYNMPQSNNQQQDCIHDAQQNNNNCQGNTHDHHDHHIHNHSEYQQERSNSMLSENNQLKEQPLSSNSCSRDNLILLDIRKAPSKLTETTQVSSSCSTSSQQLKPTDLQLNLECNTERKDSLNYRFLSSQEGSQNDLNNGTTSIQVSTPTPKNKKKISERFNTPSTKKKLHRETSTEVIKNETTQKSPQPNDIQECCGCKKSKCLKLYCECFRQKKFCQDISSCIDCMNKQQFEEQRNIAIQQIEERNSFAFESKVEAANTDTHVNHIHDHSQGQLLVKTHRKGCKCKKSDCRKNYCECYELGVMCSDLCKCLNCKNVHVEQAQAGIVEQVFIETQQIC